MLKENVLTEDNPAVPEISPEMLAELKKEDMRQAVVERFRSKVEAPAARTSGRHGVHSACWRPIDEER